MYTLNRHHCLIELHRRCCVGPIRRALPPHPCHGATAVVAHYQLEHGDGHSTQFPRLSPVGAAGTAALSPKGDTIILECGSCASNLSTSSIAPVHPVGSGTPALRAARVTQPSHTCHAVSAGKRIWALCDMYLNSVIVYLPVIQLFGRWQVQEPHADIWELIIVGKFCTSYIMFSNVPDPSDTCGLGACHSAFRQVTGTGATRWNWELIIVGKYCTSSIMFSLFTDPSDTCGLGACHSAFRQVTGTDATRLLHLIIPLAT